MRKTVRINSEGNSSFPTLDRLHVPLKDNPMHWDDYSKELLPDAEEQLRNLLNRTDTVSNTLSFAESEEIASIVQRAKWKFAWTYARTYPHEYTTKEFCSQEDHDRLIGLIEKYDIVEFFGKARRKYLYFSERKYWHMGDPKSDDPEEWPNVINRTWVDVRRHAENVDHVWGKEEVELQMRLWEIQLEKSAKH